MSEFKPYFTADGSVGLYNSEYDDIYHSADGALTEAFEKFVYPIDFDALFEKEQINVLDICYGIGYNTKSFLTYILENFLAKKNSAKKIFQKSSLNRKYIAQKYTDKILSNKMSTDEVYTDNIPEEKEKIASVYTDNNSNEARNNAAIYTDNIFGKISVTAVDSDELLTFLSPFIKTGVRNIQNQKIDFEHNDFEKYLKKKTKSDLKIPEIINFLILDKLFAQNGDKIPKNAVISHLNDKKYRKFLSRHLAGCFEYSINEQGYKQPNKGYLSNLHNIYYRYVSSWYKRRLKALRMDNLEFNIYNNDARQIIKAETKLYNLIFLDAFTPAKCPCLWSYDFFVQLHRLLAPDGVLLTYSTSAVVRSAMIAAGFHIGNIYNTRLDKFTGTIAAKNIDLIKYPLSEFDLGLLKTRAGIFYRDENLTGQNEAIIARRELEVKNSSKISSSEFIKSFNFTD